MKNRPLLISTFVAVLTAGAWFLFTKSTKFSPEVVSVSDPAPAPKADHHEPAAAHFVNRVEDSGGAEQLADFLLTGPATSVEPSGTTEAFSATVLGHPATERVYLRANDQVRIPLNRAALLADHPITLRADNGGVIDGQARSPQVELLADAASFIFHVGAHRGLYTVTVSQGSRTEILEFWVGEPTPVGRPGPFRTITPPATVSAES